MLQQSGDASAPPLGRRRRSFQAGYSLVELVITVAVILIVSAVTTPSLLNYYRSARVRAAADAVGAYLNEGRQQAIKRNSPVCIANTATTIQYRQPDCAGAPLSVTGLTGVSGNLRLPENINLSSNESAIFGSLGNASPGATYTVTDTVSNRTLTITVAPSGRVSIP